MKSRGIRGCFHLSVLITVESILVNCLCSGNGGIIHSEDLLWYLLSICSGVALNFTTRTGGWHTHTNTQMVSLPQEEPITEKSKVHINVFFFQ